MQPNYEEMMRRQQQDYERNRNPFEYGRQVAQRRYSEIMSNLDAQRQATQQSYGDLYQQARQRAIGQQASAGPMLSGGMGQQQRDFASALEIQSMGQIGSARNQAMRDLYTQGQAAFSNAQLEGQQAAQMEVQNRQTAFQLAQQRQAIMADENLDDTQKQELLNALGGEPGTGGEGVATPATFGQNVTQGIGIAASVGITGAVVGTTLSKAAQSTKTLGFLLKGSNKALTVIGKTGKAVTSKGAVTKAVAALSKTASASKGLGAAWIGAKSLLVKTGLAKATLAKGAIGLTGLGPVGWGILGVVGAGLAIGGIIALTSRNN